METPRPWFAPDAQGFLASAIVIMCFTALLVRMFSPSNIDDKMLDTMITILFSTCLVTVYQFTFGSSRGSQVKDETQSRMLEKLPTPPNGPDGSPAVVAAATVAAVEAAKAVAPAAAAAAAPAAAVAAVAAAPAAAAEAAPPAAAEAVPPAVDAELDRRGITEKPKE